MAHPLFDRRDLTAQRNAATAPAPADIEPLTLEQRETNRLLRELLTQERADISQLCVSDREPPEATMDNFPAPGARRLIVRRAGAGGLIAVAAGVPTPVLVANENRLGGEIVNGGANGVTLFLSLDLLQPGTSTPLASGAAQIRLAGGGGAWDLRLSRLLWCGNVIAVADAGGSSLSIAEV